MENIPQESETIAVKRAARITKKLLDARTTLGVARAWWTNEAIELFGLAVIVLLNLYLVLPFFRVQIPDTSYSGPIIPLVAKIFGIFGVSFSQAVHMVTLISFLLFPLSMYVFVRLLTKRKMSAFLAVLIASLPFFPFAKTRIVSGFLTQDTPHIITLALIPLAIYGLLSFIKEGGMKNLVLSAVVGSLVSLSSPFSFTTFMMFSGIACFSEMLLGQGRLKFTRLLIVLVFAGGLNSFWYNPAFFSWMVTGPMGEEIRTTLSRLVPMSMFVAPVLGVFGFLLFDRKPGLQPIFLAVFFTLVFALVVIAGGGFVPSHPTRYTPEFGISLALLFGLGILKIAEYLKFQQQNAPFLSWAVISRLILIGVFVLSGLGIVVGRADVESYSSVLGIFSDVTKGEIWEAREDFNGFSSLVGYVITFVTASALTYLATRSKQVENA